MHLLALHVIARGGDGLAPELLRLIERREAVLSDPKVVTLRRFNPAVPEVAGDAQGRVVRGSTPAPSLVETANAPVRLQRGHPPA